MIGLLIFALLGLVLLAGFVILGVMGRPQNAPDSSAMSAVSQMVKLEGIAFAHPRLLLDDTEYQILLATPELHRIAKKLRKERQELVLLWISVLQNDLITLLRFRRFLIRRGVPVGLQEELQTLQRFVLTLVVLNTLKISIRMVGPFALPSTTRHAGRLVDRMSRGVALVLSRIPAAGWPEIERTWIRSAA
jgi:hypothetical protein